MKNKEKKLNFILIILLIIISISCIVIINYLAKYFSVEEKVYYASFFVSDKIGFDLNKSALTFGEIKNGGNSAREITLYNDDKKTFVTISSRGEITDYLVASENDFIMQPNEIKKISFMIYVPLNATEKKYEGTVKLKFRKVK